MSRSLQVPGSPSSELQTIYLSPGTFLGMKLHFKPVGKPAPPRPRKLDNFISSIMFSGDVFSFKIFSNA